MRLFLVIFAHHDFLLFSQLLTYNSDISHFDYCYFDSSKQTMGKVVRFLEGLDPHGKPDRLFFSCNLMQKVTNHHEFGSQCNSAKLCRKMMMID